MKKAMIGQPANQTWGVDLGGQDVHLEDARWDGEGGAGIGDVNNAADSTLEIGRAHV